MDPLVWFSKRRKQQKSLPRRGSTCYVSAASVNITDPAFDDADVTLPDTVAESGLANEGPAVILNTAGATETEAQCSVWLLLFPIRT